MNDAQLEPFLQRIRSDRDKRLVDIRRHENEARRRLLGQAYTESRALQRETAERLRREQQQNRERRLSRTRAGIRHRRWQELARLQRLVTEAVFVRINDAWRQPESQWVWCRFWLTAAHSRAGEAMMRLQLGEVDENVRGRIEKWLTTKGVTWRLAEGLNSPGLRIRWSDFDLDGTLAAQLPYISEAALQRLAPLMPHMEQLQKRRANDDC